MARSIRIAISGAGGRIGYALVFRIAAGGMFGSEQPVALSLLEMPERLRLIQATAMELKDCAFPLLSEVRLGVDAQHTFEGADWVILLAGRPLRPGGQRADVLRDNAPSFAAQGRAINEVAPGARILVVASPRNTHCLIAMSYAPSVPAEHWFAMTRLDRMRATALIAEKAGVPVSQVTCVTAWGNHSESVYPDFENATIDDRPAPEVITDRDWVRKVFEPSVAHRSAEILSLGGASSAGSAAQAIIGSIRSITTPTPFERWFGAAVVSDGSYGVPRGLIFGFPLRTEDGLSWSIVQGLYLDAYAQGRLAANVAELEHEAATVTDLLRNL
ncbi:MAG TPA: malate dehydrogenase [Isosphaeraceae bacterium]|jgi:malate dehydrogenase|nr:malate dehydrogenase [Isosphaeraceae bacterium]